MFRTLCQSGHVRIFKSSASGREQVSCIDGTWEFGGRVAVFDGGNYPASVAAVEDAALLFVSKQDFQALCLTHPLRVVSARWRRLVGIIEDLSFIAVGSRLASFLLRMARKEGQQAGEGIAVVLPASNQELAAQIGTARELGSRNLSRFQSEGLIKIDGRSVVIANLRALESELAGND